MDYNEFAQKIKAKYPGSYDDMDNSTLAHKMVAKYPQYGDVTFGKQPGIPEMAAQASNPGKMLKTAAPSNLLKMAGVAAANAPGVASLAAGMLSPAGNPQQVITGIDNIVQNPQQVTQAASRAIQTQGGAQMTPDEQTQANMGQAAGIAMEMAGPAGLTKGVKPTGPFTAGLHAPETALPGAFEEAGNALGTAKDLARRADDPAVAARLRRLMSSPTGTSKVAEEGKAAVEAGANSSVTELLAYREALGKMQSKGGTFANDYKNAYDLATQQLAKRAPEVAAALKKMAPNYAAKDGTEFTLPALTLAVDPAVGAIKTAVNIAKTAGARNLAGGAIGGASPVVSSMDSILHLAYDKVFNRKKKGA